MLPLLLRITSGVTGVSVEEIKSRSRTQHVVDARFLSAYVMREDGMTYSEIGKALNRDHSCIIRAHRLIEEKVNAPDPNFPVLKRRLGMVLKAQEEHSQGSALKILLKASGFDLLDGNQG